MNTELLAKLKGCASADALKAAAAAAGFELTDEKAAELFTQLQTAEDPGDLDLSLDELEMVSGGCDGVSGDDSSSTGSRPRPEIM